LVLFVFTVEFFIFLCYESYKGEYRQLFGSESGVLLFKYLGISIYFRKFKNNEWKPIEDGYEMKLSCWIRKILSYGA
jgi:hypothetical protein